MECRHPLQLYDIAIRKISSHPPNISADDKEDVIGNHLEALPSLTFGAPNLATTTNNDILLTYYSVAHDTEEVTAYNFLPIWPNLDSTHHEPSFIECCAKS